MAFLLILNGRWFTTILLRKKYFICNGDEGDPGAFMDRSLLEGYPHRILEGIMIAAYATGAQKRIFLYPSRISFSY